MLAIGTSQIGRARLASAGLLVLAGASLAGCSNLLRADFRADAVGAAPATDLPGAPPGDSLRLYAHGGGTGVVVAAPPPASAKGLDVGGVNTGGVGLSTSADFVTTPLTPANYDKRKPVTMSWSMASSGPGRLTYSVNGQLAGAGDAGGWRQLLQFTIENGELRSLLSSTTRTPANFSRVTPPAAGSYTVILTLDEVRNHWRASFVVPPSLVPQGFSGIPHIDGELRPELNFANYPPLALSLGMQLSDADSPAGTPHRNVVTSVNIGQRR